MATTLIEGKSSVAGKICFVVMGFGKKTHFETGRTLDLNATFDAIIEPAVTDQGLKCIRSDKVLQAGVIDVKMYEMLLRADLVIADISTANINAVYELGVRHALRPKSTIIMQESVGKLYFDLNHLSTFMYQHLGEDIGAREARRARTELGALIAEVMSKQETDSPVYTFLSKLAQPRMPDEEFAKVVDRASTTATRFAELLKAGDAATKASQHAEAVRAFEEADKMVVEADDTNLSRPYIVQQLALNRYKTGTPTKLDALLAGRDIINRLSPDNSNDPETLGIAGAIGKRLWLLTSDREQLDAAIRYYARGFEVRRDYYNGENLATCYDFRADAQKEPAEAQYDRMTAGKIRQILTRILDEVIASPSFVDRSDRLWVYATRANCAFALKDAVRGEDNEARFFGEKPAQWQIDTYRDGKKASIAVAAKS